MSTIKQQTEKRPEFYSGCFFFQEIQFMEGNYKSVFELSLRKQKSEEQKKSAGINNFCSFIAFPLLWLKMSDGHM